MILHTRPPQPQGFPPDKVVRARQRLHEQGSAGGAPEHWQDWKHHFFRAQHKRCGWCDVDQVGHVGAVDHIAPKGAVDGLAAHGREVDDSTHFIGRLFDPLHDVGYWWLTYAWENLTFACDRCNSYKRALYPVEEDPHPRPSHTSPPTPLLLHPFGPDDPHNHLDVDAIGQIRPHEGSRRGRATIDTCGLDRETLRSKREKVVARIEKYCELLGRTENDDYVVQLLRDAVAEDAELASVARAVVRRELGIHWREV